jgi:hypothetical protein
VAQKLYVNAAPLPGLASKLLNKDRIEKEPLSLIDEIFAALVFLFVCTYGLFTGVA